MHALSWCKEKFGCSEHNYLAVITLMLKAIPVKQNADSAWANDRGLWLLSGCVCCIHEMDWTDQVVWGRVMTSPSLREGPSGLGDAYE